MIKLVPRTMVVNEILLLKFLNMAAPTSCAKRTIFFSFLSIQVMKQFPQSLQEEISCYLHFNVIKNCPLFECAEESCLWSLAIRMLRIHHLPNNVIVRQGANVHSVYFIKRGRLDVCRNGAVVGRIGMNSFKYTVLLEMF